MLRDDRINIVKIATIHTYTHTQNQPNKNNKTRIDQTILSNKRTPGDVTSHDLRLYYRTIVIKTAWYWHCGGLKKNAPKESDTIRKYDLVGGSMSLGESYEVSDAQVRSSGSLFLLPSDQDVELSATFPVPCLPA